MAKSDLPIVIPKALQKGDTIAFASPSARLNNAMPEAIARGKTCFESLGFQVKIIYTALSSESSIADSVHVRCDELHSTFRDGQIAGIICTVGGSHANELLPFLDYDLIRSNPKIFMGYSDSTFLHYAIQSRTGLRTFYGPTILTDWAEYPTPFQFTVDHFLQVLTSPGQPVGPLPRSSVCSAEHNDFFLSGNAPEQPRKSTLSPPWRWLRKGRASGNLCGGTVSCVVRLQGTPYAPRSWKGKILLLESSLGDDPSLPYSVTAFRGNLADLALAGVFDEISGLVIGRGYKYDDAMQSKLADAILYVCGETMAGKKSITASKDFPILMNVDFGHTSPFLTLPIGALARLDSESDEFCVLDPGVQ